jgi:GrpB-like predicted nucleotidyltransferase (UPF0157 family)
MPEPVIIVPYDPAWPGLFEQLRAPLAAALGDLALVIHHVGSTSVPGLPAKPIIDLDVVIASEAQMPAVIERLASIDYAHWGEQGIAGRHAFKPPARLPKHHPYVCAADNRELARHLAFRDHLRRHPDEAAAYAALKRQLADQYGADRDGYSIAKTDFVERVLAEAAARQP